MGLRGPGRCLPAGWSPVTTPLATRQIAFFRSIPGALPGQGGLSVPNAAGIQQRVLASGVVGALMAGSSRKAVGAAAAPARGGVRWHRNGADRCTSQRGRRWPPSGADSADPVSATRTPRVSSVARCRLERRVRPRFSRPRTRSISARRRRSLTRDGVLARWRSAERRSQQMRRSASRTRGTGHASIRSMRPRTLACPRLLRASACSAACRRRSNRGLPRTGWFLDIACLLIAAIGHAASRIPVQAADPDSIGERDHPVCPMTAANADSRERVDRSIGGCVAAGGP